MTLEKRTGILEGIEKEIVSQTAWQRQHQIDDAVQFAKINDGLQSLPNKEDIIDAITTQIKITVNGKIDNIKAHLDKQDESMASADIERRAMRDAVEELRKKIRPFDTAKTWAGDLVQVILYVGGIGAAFGGIIFLLNTLGIHFQI